MKIRIALLSSMVLLASPMSYAGLKVLDNDEMQTIEAQGGVDLGLLLRLNQKDSSGNLSSQGAYNTNHDLSFAATVIDPRNSIDCENRQFCRLAMAFNNRFSSTDTDGVAATTTQGNKQWLVFKGLQGYIKIPKLSLDAANVTDITRFSGEAVAPNHRVALKLGLTRDNPIQIHHLGFEALSIEVGSSAASAGNHYGYLNMSNCSTGSALCPVAGFSNGKYTNAGFDNGREIGFVGLDIHGSLAVNSNMYLFSCQSRGNC